MSDTKNENSFNNKFKVWFSAVKLKSKKIKMELGALYIAYKRPDVPFYAKLVSVLVVGYALSPVDLIPDFIPVLGYIDDLLLIPLGIAFAIKLMPANIMDECRKEAENIFREGKPKNWTAGILIIGLWIVLISFLIIKVI